MKKIPFGTIFQVIQLIAIGYLVFKILQPSSATKKLEQIEANQLKLKVAVEQIISSNALMYHRWDSVNAVRAKKIDSLSNNIDFNIKQVRTANKKMDNLKNIFLENRVELPNPDEQ